MRPTDPVADVERVADLLDQTLTLMDGGCPLSEVKDIQRGLAARLRQDVTLIRNGESVPQ